MTFTCPPDHKHNDTSTCYAQHKCRCVPCSETNKNYHRNIRIAAGDDVQVSARGARRRLRALATLGYSCKRLGALSRMNPDALTLVRAGKRTRIKTSTHVEIASLYARVLALRPMVTNRASRQRNAAAAAGWVGPLGWDDIDRDEKSSEWGS